MIPGVSHGNSSGMSNASHRVMKRAPLSAPSLSIAPDNFIGLLATTPTGRPSILISAVTIVWPKWRRNSSIDPVSARVSMICRTS